jgi:hypothetical protein
MRQLSGRPVAGLVAVLRFAWWQYVWQSGEGEASNKCQTFRHRKRYAGRWGARAVAESGAGHAYETTALTILWLGGVMNEMKLNNANHLL